MSESGYYGGPNGSGSSYPSPYYAGPNPQTGPRTASVNEVELIDPGLNRSRQSHLSNQSFASNMTAASVHLGGVQYPVGARFGRNGHFVIGDPGASDPNQTRMDTTADQSFADSTSKKKKKDPYPTIFGHKFENWNWSVFRFVCIGLIILAICLVIAIVVGIVVSQQNKWENRFNWWEGSVMYRISVPYFMNAQKDLQGLGDLSGISKKAAFLTYFGVQVVVLGETVVSSSRFWDPVDSFTRIDPRLGSVNDFQNMITALHNENKKVILELKPAYTSTNHEWYMSSKSHGVGRPSQFEDCYIWRSAPDRSFNGEWTFEVDRDAFYFHRNNSAKPILNWDSGKVQQEFEAVLEDWLMRGVDGFVIQSWEEMHISRDSDMIRIIQRWRDMIDKYQGDGDRRILVLGEAFLNRLQNTASLDGVLELTDLVEVPFSLDFEDTTDKLEKDVMRGLTTWQLRPGGPWVYWSLQNASLIDKGYLTSVMLYMLTLPGNPGFVAGQEVGVYIYDELNGRVAPPASPVLWRSESIFPYNPGSILNETTMAQVKSLALVRHESFTLRTDFDYASNGRKTFTIDFPQGIPPNRNPDQTIVVKRQKARYNSYYLIGNFYKETVLHDWYDIVSGGEIIADSKAFRKGTLLLEEDLKLFPGQSIVIEVE